MNIFKALRGDGARRHYQDRGYQVFRGAFAADEIAGLAQQARQLVPAYAGLALRQSGELEVNKFFPSSPLVRNSLLNAHLRAPAELEVLAVALRQLITSRALLDRLQALDGEEHYTIHQSILFMTAQITDIHLDSWSLDTAPHGFAHTVWIPLQDMNPESGVPSIIPWPRARRMTEAELGLPEEGSTGERYGRFHDALAERLLAAGPEAVTPLMRKGDFVVWSSLTPHFTMPSRPWPVERLALQVLVRPTRHTWGTYVIQPAKWTIDRSVKVTDQFSFLVV